MDIYMCVCVCVCVSESLMLLSTERIMASDLSFFISESSILRLIVYKNLLQMQK